MKRREFLAVGAAALAPAAVQGDVLEWAHDGVDVKGFTVQEKILNGWITVDELPSDMRRWHGAMPGKEYRVRAFNDEGHSEWVYA